MPVRARSTTPAIKDQIAKIGYILGTPPAVGMARVMFMNPWYDYEVKSITALVQKDTVAAACPFTLGIGAYTNRFGQIIAPQPAFFLTTLNCVSTVGITTSPFSTSILLAGSLHVMPVPFDNGQGSTVLPAGAPLIITPPAVTNAGEIIVTVLLRPKDWDRGDSSKRPWGASDDAFATYYK